VPKSLKQRASYGLSTKFENFYQIGERFIMESLIS